MCHLTGQVGESLSAAKRRKRRNERGVNYGGYYELCDVVRETGLAIHRCHKHGHVEKGYEKAMAALRTLWPSRMVWSRLVNCLPRTEVLVQRLSRQAET